MNFNYFFSEGMDIFCVNKDGVNVFKMEYSKGENGEKDSLAARYFGEKGQSIDITGKKMWFRIDMFVIMLRNILLDSIIEESVRNEKHKVFVISVDGEKTECEILSYDDKIYFHYGFFKDVEFDIDDMNLLVVNEKTEKILLDWFGIENVYSFLKEIMENDKD